MAHGNNLLRFLLNTAIPFFLQNILNFILKLKLVHVKYK